MRRKLIKRSPMVRITRSHTWEEFHRDLLYKWIERLSELEEHNDEVGTTRVLGCMVAFVACIVLFVVSASLMIIFYRRVDPRHPTSNPHPLTFRELFGVLGQLNEKPINEKFLKVADGMGKVLGSATNVTQQSRGSIEAATAQSRKSVEEEIVAVSTKVTQSTPAAVSPAPVPAVVKPSSTDNRKPPREETSPETTTMTTQMSKEKMAVEAVKTEKKKEMPAESTKEVQLGNALKPSTTAKRACGGGTWLPAVKSTKRSTSSENSG